MVVGTRSQKKMEGFGDLIDKKLAEFKNAIVNQFQETLDSYISEKKMEFETFFSSKIKDLEEVALKTVSKVPESSPVNEELRQSIKAIENHVMEVRAENILLRNQVEDLQQYIRRPNVRIFGVPLPPGEKTQNVEETVKSMLLSTDIHPSSID